jgi:alpha-galactosidase
MLKSGDSLSTPIFILDVMRQVLPSSGSTDHSDPGHATRSEG